MENNKNVTGQINKYEWVQKSKVTTFILVRSGKTLWGESTVTWISFL